GDHAMLIDAGDNSKGTTVQLYLKKQGVEKLDYLVGTHPDADHIGGLDVIITKFPCDRVIMPAVERDSAAFRDVVMAMDYKGYENTLPVPGAEYRLGDAVFTIIAPNRDYGEDYNNHSVGILLQYGDTGFLFTGDAEEEAEADMLKNGIALKADVLKAGHHGSSDASSVAFLDAVRPSFVVVSCGKDNDYGHPHEGLLRRLKERGIFLYRTDDQGSIIAVSDGEKITWSCEPSENWDSGWTEKQ
ncbi:MAG: ComEC/Rec2 family competence protein, partial [Suilimivivens sp.]